MSRDQGISVRIGGPAMAPSALARAIVRLDIQDRARVLSKLLGFVGPLALAVLGGGAFARYVRFARKAFVPVTMEDAARTTVSQIQELVRYVLQSHPGVIRDGLLER